MAAPETFALVERPEDAVLFRRAGAALNRRHFLRDAQRLADALPEASHVCNMCADRYVFAVGLVAAALRGQISLLTSDRSPATLRALAERHGRVATLAETAFAGPLAHHVALLPDEPPLGVVANPRLSAEQVVAIVFTSGSTGAPVGHAKSWGALVTRSRAGGARFGFDEAAPPSVVGTVPAQHMYGFETTLLLPLHAAASSFAAPCSYPADIADALAAVPAPRILVTTPLHARALLESRLALPPLAAVISATAPLAAELAEAAERRWSAPVLEIFGATEVGSIASRRTLGDRADGEWTLYEGVRLAGAPPLVTAPFASPHKLADRIDSIGETRFVLLGRGSDIVKLGGRRASLAGLTAILTRISGVRDGVFVAPDDLDQRPTARLHAFVVAPEREPADILAELREQVDPVFTPRRIVRVDALPRNSVGKLTREALRALQATLGQPAPGEG